MDTLEREKEIDLLERERCPFKEGEKCWVLNGDGCIFRMEWGYHSLMLGNAFKTAKEAILETERRMLLTRFKMFRDKCNRDWKTNFYREQRHHYIDFYNSEDVLFTNSTFFKSFDLFGYFKNESDCDKAIELFGDEIKRLYVEV